MLWAAATLCFFGFLRAGEITIPSDKGYDPTAHLSFFDIAVDNMANPSIMQVHIKTSKTDPFQKGVSIYVGRTGNNLCPIAAMLTYLSIRGGDAGQLFHFHYGRQLTRERFIAKVRRALTAACIEENKYAGHSFRVGAATTAVQCSIPDATIQLLGRWESTAGTAYLYV